MPVRHCQFTLLGLRHVLYFNLLNFISVTPPHSVLSRGTPVWIYSFTADSRCHLFLHHGHHIRGTASCYKEQILRGASEQVHQSRCCKPRHDVEVAGGGLGGLSMEGTCNSMVPCLAETTHSPEIFLQDHQKEMPFWKGLMLSGYGAVTGSQTFSGCVREPCLREVCHVKLVSGQGRRPSDAS